MLNLGEGGGVVGEGGVLREGGVVDFPRKSFSIAFPSTIQLFVREACSGASTIFRHTKRFAVLSNLLATYVVRGPYHCFPRKSFFIAFSSTFHFFVREAALPTAPAGVGRGHSGCKLFGDQCYFRHAKRFAARS